jgi:transposase
MPRYIEGQDRQQVTLMPECLDDFIADDNPVRLIDAFIGELGLTKLGFEGTEPAATGRPSHRPVDLLRSTSMAT